MIYHEALMLGERLKKIRLEKKISYYRIWKDIGIPTNTTKRCELGNGSLKSYEKLFNYLVGDCQIRLFDDNELKSNG